VRGRYGSGLDEAQFRQVSDISKTWKDWGGGAAVSQAIDEQPGAYASGEAIYTRTAHVVAPSGALFEVPILLTRPQGNGNYAVIRPGRCTGIFELNGHLYLLMGRYCIRVRNGSEDILGGVFNSGSPTTTDLVDSHGGFDLGAVARFLGWARFGSDVYLGTERTPNIGSPVPVDWSHFGGGSFTGFTSDGTRMLTLWKLIGSGSNIGRFTNNKDGLTPFTGSETFTTLTNIRAGYLASLYMVDDDGVGGQRLINVPSADLQDPPSTGLTYKALRYFIHCVEGAEPLARLNEAGDPWNAPTRIAGSEYDVTQAIASAKHVFFATTGGIVDVDGRGYSATPTTYWQHQFDADNGAVGGIFNGFLYARHRFGLDRIPLPDGPPRPNDLTGYCGVGQGLANETEIYGECTAWTVESGWMLASFFNGRDSFIMSGREREVVGRPGPGPILWTGPEAVLRDQVVTHLKASQLSAAQPRLWITTIAASQATSENPTSGRLFWLSLAPQGNPVQEYITNLDAQGRYQGNHRFARFHAITMAATDFERQVLRKVLHRTDIRADGLSNDTYYKVFASADGNPFYLQGSGPTGLVPNPRAQTSPRSQLLPAQGLTEGHNITIRLEGYAPDVSEPDDGEGQSTSASNIDNNTGLLFDTTKTWTINEFAGIYQVEIMDGPQAGQIRKITANTSQGLTVNPAWDAVPDNGSTYQISRSVDTGLVQSAASSEILNTTTITDTLVLSESAGGLGWTVDSLVGFLLEIYDGTGVGQVRTIIDNTASTITVAPAFSPTPDTTSKYRVIRGWTKRPAILREVQVRAGEIAEPRDTRTYRVILGQAQAMRNTTLNPDDAGARWERLVAMQRTGPTWMVDEMGKRLWVKVEPGISYEEEEWKQQATEKFERVLVAEVTISVIPHRPEELSLTAATPVRAPTNRRIMRWDSGDKWDTGLGWKES
jgi:hypothetical protein